MRGPSDQLIGTNKSPTEYFKVQNTTEIMLCLGTLALGILV